MDHPRRTCTVSLSKSVNDSSTYPGFVESAPHTDPLRSAHVVCFLAQLLLEWAFPLGHLQLFLPFNERRGNLGRLLLG